MYLFSRLCCSFPASLSWQADTQCQGGKSFVAHAAAALRRHSCGHSHRTLAAGDQGVAPLHSALLHNVYLSAPRPAVMSSHWLTLGAGRLKRQPPRTPSRAARPASASTSLPLSKPARRTHSLPGSLTVAHPLSAAAQPTHTAPGCLCAPASAARATMSAQSGRPPAGAAAGAVGEEAQPWQPDQFVAERLERARRMLAESECRGDPDLQARRRRRRRSPLRACAGGLPMAISSQSLCPPPQSFVDQTQASFALHRLVVDGTGQPRTGLSIREKEQARLARGLAECMQLPACAVPAHAQLPVLCRRRCCFCAPGSTACGMWCRCLA